MHVNQLRVPNPRIGWTPQEPEQTRGRLRQLTSFLKLVWEEPCTRNPSNFRSPRTRTHSVIRLMFSRSDVLEESGMADRSPWGVGENGTEKPPTCFQSRMFWAAWPLWPPSFLIPFLANTCWFIQQIFIEYLLCARHVGCIGMYILTRRERRLFISTKVRIISLFKGGKCHGKIIQKQGSKSTN